MLGSAAAEDSVQYLLVQHAIPAIWSLFPHPPLLQVYQWVNRQGLCREDGI